MNWAGSDGPGPHNASFDNHRSHQGVSFSRNYHASTLTLSLTLPRTYFVAIIGRYLGRASLSWFKTHSTYPEDLNCLT